MGPPSIDYSITLFGGEGNETHGSLSANNVVVVHVIATLGVVLRLQHISRTAWERS